ncbi:phosphatidylserine decarboxylase [Thiogranum longum]|uniref:Phosphatidylserine decarboxylase proenzyme n=1 Tax=Thiogranum longum TaxID=1537524 RepID=A0A4R1HF08_9GAMM|nr:archaetidylserine decarboxylase [Thiogranum longum]TCK18790.1 phosphatidylserine decarboxylase [Thiogranum longum]
MPAVPTASWQDYLKSLPLYLLPHHAISRLTLRLTRLRTRWFKNAFIHWFTHQYDVNLDESLYRQAQDFEHFNAFFTRELAPGTRPIEGDACTVVSPADGHISQIGDIDDDTVFQAKGHSFSVTELLGGDTQDAGLFRNGSFITVYLSPRDYHRVHMPLEGKLRRTIYVPGRLFSVAPHTTRVIPRLFARNERLVALFDTCAGPMAMVLVGAINVAAIETVWAGLVTPPHRRQIEARDFTDSDIILQRGSEMGRFNMGSTVIVLFGEHAVRWQSMFAAEAPLRMGEAIGSAENPR